MLFSQNKNIYIKCHTYCEICLFGFQVLSHFKGLCYSPGTIVIHHLSSVELVKTDAKSIHKAIVDVIEGYKIPWKNLMSVLLDSCNVMRGCKSGKLFELSNKLNGNP